MAGLMLMAMIVVMVVVLFIQLVRQKPLKNLLLWYGAILMSYHLFVTFSCGPNSSDVKVMKPMAQKIADHIVAHGIPKSLKDIPDLPYRLEGCVMKIIYQNEYDEKVESNNAYLSIKDESCTFYYKKDKKYTIWIWFAEHYVNKQLTHGSIELNAENSKTGVDYSFTIEKYDRLSFDKNRYPFVYSSKTSGICNPMRQ